MEAMIEAFKERGMEAPEGLVNLIQMSSSRRVIYRTLWAAARFGAGLGYPMKTYVFPAVVREAIREKFPESPQGAYDDQYEGRGDVYYVSLDDMCIMTYPKKKN